MKSRANGVPAGAGSALEFSGEWALQLLLLSAVIGAVVGGAVAINAAGL